MEGTYVPSSNNLTLTRLGFLGVFFFAGGECLVSKVFFGKTTAGGQIDSTSAFYGLMKTQNLPTIIVQQFKQRLMMKNHTIESISKHKILSPKVD